MQLLARWPRANRHNTPLWLVIAVCLCATPTLPRFASAATAAQDSELPQNAFTQREPRVMRSDEFGAKIASSMCPMNIELIWTNEIDEGGA
jgi:hypothetical protein